MKNQVLFFIALLFLVSCSNNDKTGNQSVKSTTNPNASTVQIKIESNDAMEFNITEFEVFEGQNIELTLEHTGEMPLAAMGHNWVLLKQGVNEYDFGMKAMKASETDYIPESEKDKVIAHTKTLGGGESDTIIFQAPKAGTYTYCCTFPNHFAIMKGKMTVR